jgi:hypothetical protein
MTKITIDRAVVEQALEALEMSRRFVYADNRPQCDDAITALRAALAEPVQEPVKFKCTVIDDAHPDGVPLSQWGKQPVQEPALTVDALRVEFERRYRGNLGITRVEGGVYLSPAIETEWQQFVRKYTSPPQRKPLAEWEINDLMADIDPEDVDSWSFRQGVYAAEKHHGVKP